VIVGSVTKKGGGRGGFVFKNHGKSVGTKKQAYALMIQNVTNVVAMPSRGVANLTAIFDENTTPHTGNVWRLGPLPPYARNAKSYRR
jgi:hypothetical protein